MTELPPYLWLYAGALLALVTRGAMRNALMMLLILISAYFSWQIEADTQLVVSLLGFEAQVLRADKLSLLFVYLFHIALFIGTLYAWHVRDSVQVVAAMAYGGSAIGAVLAGDLVTLFVFWELLALTSVFLIWARRTPESTGAGIRYLLMQVLSGVLLLGGVLIYGYRFGDYSFNHIGIDHLPGMLIFLAFGIKACFPLLHNWLTDAYPEATATGTVFLSAMTTKVAIYALARGYAGTEILVYIGALMTCFPIFYAVIENDLRRVLAYSMINQLGFMVCGIGIGTALAVNGAVAHAFNDVIFKGLLMMSMGAVLHRVGHVLGSDLGGLYKSMPKTTVLCIIGAASISAFPLFSGFVSKSMVMTAALNEGYHIVWLGLLFASAGVFHHAGIKIPFFAFFAHDSGIRVKEAPTHMLLAMSIAAALCITIGVYPDLLYRLLPFATDYVPYDATHVLAQLQLLFFSALAFAWLKLRGLYPPELRSVNIDAEWLYRRALPATGNGLWKLYNSVLTGLANLVRQPWQKGLSFMFAQRGPRGMLARSWPTGSMVLWVAVLLTVTLLLNYL